MRQRHELEEEAEDSEVELTSAAAAANVIAKLSARIDSVQTEVTEPNWPPLSVVLETVTVHGGSKGRWS